MIALWRLSALYGVVAKNQARAQNHFFPIESSDSMTNPEFKWKHFAPEIILWCLRLSGSSPMSYANLSDMLAERGARLIVRPFIVGSLNMARHYVRSYVAINLSGQTLRGSSMKPM
ncbi:hypothetical protein VCHA29O37_730003 [Vibrio chagasii]|nr:hypothetical protein VCHA29O37_730003 [Vibrio chagasii]